MAESKISENYIKQIELVQKNTETGDNESTLINVGSPHIKNITYSELKTLKKNKKLDAGVWYRVTDYGTITSDNFAGHRFDILTLAISNNVLNEECLVVSNSEYIDETTNSDKYFGNCNLSLWKVWYTIDDDKYTYAPDSNGRIYRMIDDFGNDCPFDFKNYLNNDKTYTFNPCDEDGNFTESLDLSVTTTNCKNNIIKSVLKNGNNIHLMNNNNEIYNNYIESDCIDINIINSNDVTIKYGCENIIILNSTNIVIDSMILQCTIKHSFNCNIEHDCKNIFITHCNSINIKYGCNSITINNGDYTVYASKINIGYNCADITCYNRCYNLHIESNCNNINIGEQSKNVITYKNIYINNNTRNIRLTSSTITKKIIQNIQIYNSISGSSYSKPTTLTYDDILSDNMKHYEKLNDEIYCWMI